MKVALNYLGRSGLRQESSGTRILELAPNLARDVVAFDAPLAEPLRFREAISALHDVVINDLTFTPRDKAAYQAWKAEQASRELAIRQQGREQGKQEFADRGRPSRTLQRDYKAARGRYWKSRRELNQHLRRHNQELWRKLMPFDPVITVADDVVFFECFSADESSYGCLTIDRGECFGAAATASVGTTNVDYSWDLYYNFQALRTYRETRFHINPAGFELGTSGRDTYREENINLPDGWLRGFMQLQAAMGLPMRRVPLSVASMYSLLAFLKRHKARTSPRAVRFELADGASPRMVLEPFEQVIESSGTIYHGPHDEPIRIWGRGRLLTLARLLPLAQGIDLYLSGTGLPSFWVVRMGSMRLTLGLSGWTTNDWTRGSAVQMLLPPASPTERVVAGAAESLSQCRSASLAEMTNKIYASTSNTAAALNELALRGQVIFDLHADAYRWRQVLPLPLSDQELGPPHPELLGARRILQQRLLQLGSCEPAPRGGSIVAGKVEGKPCEVLFDGDGVVKKGKCLCGWHLRFGIRNGPCRHLQALRDFVWNGDKPASGNWYDERMRWSGKT